MPQQMYVCQSKTHSLNMRSMLIRQLYIILYEHKLVHNNNKRERINIIKNERFFFQESIFMHNIYAIPVFSSRFLRDLCDSNEAQTPEVITKP